MFTSVKKIMLGMTALIVATGLFMFKPAAQNMPDLAREDTLIIGVQSGYPPFEFMNKEGQIVGFDIEVADQLAKKMGKKLVVQDMEFEGLILSLKQEKIDLIISGMNITTTRLKEIVMIPYHGGAATKLSLVFWNRIPENIKTMTDIASMPLVMISVESGSIPEEYMKSKHPAIKTKSFQGSLAPLMDVKYGKSTANLVQPEVAEYLKNQHQEVQVLEIPLEPEEQILGFGIGIKKENAELTKQIQEIVKEMRASGQLRQLEDKWFKGVQAND